jgi:hypothetical protein
MNPGEGVGIGLVLVVLGAVWFLTRKKSIPYSDEGEQTGKEGIHDMVTDEREQITAHFYAREFRCPCNRCTGFKIARNLVVLIEVLREGLYQLTGEARPLFVLSGYRCPAHNLHVKGDPHSLHMAGLAADLRTPLRMTAIDFHRFVYVYWYKASRGGLGLYDWGVHLDVGPAGRLWDERSRKTPLA